MSSTIDASVAALAALQHGVLSRSQAMRLGLTSAALSRRLHQGRWVEVHPGVYAIGGAPASHLQTIWAAVLAVGTDAVVSHRNAAELHGIEGVPKGLVEVTVAHGWHHRVRGAIVHQARVTAPAEHVCEIAPGLVGTTVDRTLVDLAAVVSTARLRYAVDEALAGHRATLASVASCLAIVARPGKRGIRKLGRVLDDLGPGYVPPASTLERTLFEVLRAGGLSAPIRQYQFPGRQRVAGCVDAAYPDVRLIVESDGRRWHTRVQDLRRDHDRDADAARAGWQTLRFLHEHIDGDPVGVCATVRDVRAARSALPPSTLEAIAAGTRDLLPPK